MTLKTLYPLKGEVTAVILGPRSSTSVKWPRRVHGAGKAPEEPLMGRARSGAGPWMSLERALRSIPYSVRAAIDKKQPGARWTGSACWCHFTISHVRFHSRIHFDISTSIHFSENAPETVPRSAATGNLQDALSCIPRLTTPATKCYLQEETKQITRTKRK